MTRKSRNIHHRHPPHYSSYGASSVCLAIGTSEKTNVEPSFDQHVSQIELCRSTALGCNAESSSMLFPTSSAVNEVFSSRHPLTAARSHESTPKPLQVKAARPQFSIWSVAEDAKSKANALSEEAQKEIQKARFVHFGVNLWRSAPEVLDVKGS